MVGSGVALAWGCGGGGGSNGSARTACAKNLLRLNRSLLTYAADSDDVLPREDWNDALTPYLPNAQTGVAAVLRCPSVPPGGDVGYAFNAALVGTQLNSVESPDGTPTLFDTAGLAPNVVAAYPPPSPSGRHGGDCVVYLSGRAMPDVDPDVPTPATVRERCLSNLKAIGAASALYASDNDDRMPVERWTDAYTPYVAESDRFRCPAVAVGSYGYAFDPSLLGVNVTTVSNPAGTPLVFDASILTRNALSAYGSNVANRHEGPNALYLDGHATSVGP